MSSNVRGTAKDVPESTGSVERVLKSFKGLSVKEVQQALKKLRETDERAEQIEKFEERLRDKLLEDKGFRREYGKIVEQEVARGGKIKKKPINRYARGGKAYANGPRSAKA